MVITAAASGIQGRGEVGKKRNSVAETAPVYAKMTSSRFLQKAKGQRRFVENIPEFARGPRVIMHKAVMATASDLTYMLKEAVSTHTPSTRALHVVESISSPLEHGDVWSGER